MDGRLARCYDDLCGQCMQLQIPGTLGLFWLNSLHTPVPVYRRGLVEFVDRLLKHTVTWAASQADVSAVHRRANQDEPSFGRETWDLHWYLLVAEKSGRLLGPTGACGIYVSVMVVCALIPTE